MSDSDDMLRQTRALVEQLDAGALELAKLVPRGFDAPLLVNLVELLQGQIAEIRWELGLTAEPKP